MNSATSSLLAWSDIIGFNNMTENIIDGVKNVFPIVSTYYYLENILDLGVTHMELLMCTKHLEEDRSPFICATPVEDGKMVEIHRYNVRKESDERELFKGSCTTTNGNATKDANGVLIPSIFGIEPSDVIASDGAKMLNCRINMLRNEWQCLHKAKEQRMRVLMKNVYRPPFPPTLAFPSFSDSATVATATDTVKEPMSPLSKTLDDARKRVELNKSFAAMEKNKEKNKEKQKEKKRNGGGDGGDVDDVANVDDVNDDDDDLSIPILETDNENSSDEDEDDRHMSGPRRKKTKSDGPGEKLLDKTEETKDVLVGPTDSNWRLLAKVSLPSPSPSPTATTTSIGDDDKAHADSSASKIDAKTRVRVADIINDITAKSADINDDIFTSIKAEVITLINDAIQGTAFKVHGALRVLESARRYVDETRFLNKQIMVLSHKLKMSEDQLSQSSVKLIQSEERVELKQQTIDAQKKQVSEAKAARVQADKDKLHLETKNSALLAEIETRGSKIEQEQVKQQSLRDKIITMSAKIKDLENSNLDLTNTIAKSKERFQEMRTLRETYKTEMEAKMEAKQHAFDQYIEDMRSSHEKLIDKFTADARNELANVRQQCKCKQLQEKNSSLALELAAVHKNLKASQEREQTALYSVMGLEIECKSLRKEEHDSAKLIKESRAYLKQCQEQSLVIESLRQENKKLLADPQSLRHHLVTEGDLGDMEWRHRSAIDQITKERVRREVVKRTKESRKCTKCNTRQINCVIVPCGHGICDTCYSSITDCHLCQAHVIMSIPKYEHSGT